MSEQYFGKILQKHFLKVWWRNVDHNQIENSHLNFFFFNFSKILFKKKILNVIYVQIKLVKMAKNEWIDQMIDDREPASSITQGYAYWWTRGHTQASVT